MSGVTTTRSVSRPRTVCGEGSFPSVTISGLITLIIRPGNLPAAALLLVYTITWLLEMGGLALFWDLPGPALVGGFVMGSLAIAGWRAFLRS